MYDLFTVALALVLRAVTVVLEDSTLSTNLLIWLSTPSRVNAVSDDSAVAMMTCQVVRCLLGRWWSAMWASKSSSILTPALFISRIISRKDEVYVERLPSEQFKDRNLVNNLDQFQAFLEAYSSLIAAHRA